MMYAGDEFVEHGGGGGGRGAARRGGGVGVCWRGALKFGARWGVACGGARVMSAAAAVLQGIALEASY